MDNATPISALNSSAAIAGTGLNPVLEPAPFTVNSDTAGLDEVLLQSQRWESVGRLSGGVVHDFNNLLTGIMLYCDLLLASMETTDRRRRYADEIRAAIAQATALTRQLLLFARPQVPQTGILCLNQVVESMQGLLFRLIGENIALDLQFDSKLSPVKIDPSHAQQILLNLVLNARDALPKGGRIVVELRNCKLQPVISSTSGKDLPWGATGLPCVLLMVSDNGSGMDEKTRQHLFEPFFTTKNSGTGLGLSIVHRIVTASQGFIDIASESGRGTRVMALLPRADESLYPDSSIAAIPPSKPPLFDRKNTPLQLPAKEQYI
jgi:two-component system, cell cycle sensor histidine kinase and response regulator CckA